jgi:hypothetical protein
MADTTTYHVIGNGETEVYDDETQAIEVARKANLPHVHVTRLVVSGTYRSTQVVWPEPAGPIHSN